MAAEYSGWTDLCVFFLVFYTSARVGGEIGAASGSALLQSSDHPPLWQDKGYTFIK